MYFPAILCSREVATATACSPVARDHTDSTTNRSGSRSRVAISYEFSGAFSSMTRSPSVWLTSMMTKRKPRDI